MDTIVVGVDGSAASIAALRCAAGLAAGTGARIRAVAVWDNPAYSGWAALPAPAEGRTEARLFRASRSRAPADVRQFAHMQLVALPRILLRAASPLG